MSFQFILSGEYQQTLDLDFKRALRDIRSEKGCYVLKSFCQNVEVVSYFLYIFLTYIYIYIYFLFLISYICDTAYFCVHPYNICGEASALHYGEEQSF